MSIPSLACHVSLLAFVLTSAVAKLISGHAAQYSTSPFVYYAASVFELAAVGLLLSRHWKVGSLIVVVLSAIGLVFTVANRGDCGCFGSLTPSDWRLALGLTGTVGGLGALSLMQPVGIGALLRGSASASVDAD